MVIDMLSHMEPGQDLLSGTVGLSTNLDIYSKNCGSFGFMQNRLESKGLQIMYTNHIIWQEKRL